MHPQGCFLEGGYMIIKLLPYFSSKVWGGYKISAMFDNALQKKYGEAWLISGHEHGMSIVMNKDEDTLQVFYANNRHLFANDERENFPLLIKIIDACENLSVQVHPDDAYAAAHEESLGKTESWYVLDAGVDAKIIIGHRGNKEEAKKMIDANNWGDLLIYKEVKSGDFFHIPAGTVHAICNGTLVYEVQQSSDITYRLYDYNRLENGKLRETHKEHSLNVMKPYTYEEEGVEIIEGEGFQLETLTNNQFYSLQKCSVKTHGKLENERYMLCTVIEGYVCIKDETYEKFDSFIICSDEKTVHFNGEGQLLIATPK